MFPQTKKTRLHITKGILYNITRQEPMSLQDLNINTAFKVAWAGFLCMGKFTYTKAELANRKLFNATRSDITFSQNNQYVVLRLKRSKTDVKHRSRDYYCRYKRLSAQCQPSENSLC